MCALIGATLACAAFSVRATATDNPEPGIWLEMGLLACERGEPESAERLFRHIEEHFDPPPGIRALIARARDSLCPAPRPPKGRVAAGAGWSSNVNRGPTETRYFVPGTAPLELRLSEELRPRADGHAFADAERVFPVGPGALLLFGSLRRHFSAHAFDEDLFGLSYQLARRLPGGIDWRATGALARSLLGGERHADHRSLNAVATWPAFALSAHWQAIDYPHAPSFDSRQLILRVGGGLRWNGWDVAVRLGALMDRAAAERPGGDRHGWLADVRAAHPGPRSSSFEIDWRAERSRSRAAYLPGLFDMRRDRRHVRLELAWQFPQGGDEAWRLSWTMTQSRDSVPFLDFRQNTFGIARIWLLR